MNQWLPTQQYHTFQLKKRHQVLAFHRVRGAVASDMVGFYHIPGDKNPADILSKNWGFQQVWWQLKTLLYWSGDTSDIKEEATVRKVQSHVRIGGEYHNPIHAGSSVAYLRSTPIPRSVWILEFSCN